MKIAAKQIAGFIKAPKANGCVGALIYGPDEGQMREYARDVAKAVVADPSDPFSVAELDDEQLKADPSKLADELFAISLMGGDRLVRLDAKAESTGKLLKEIFDEGKPAEAFMLVCAGELTPRSSLRALFEKDKRLAAVACYKDEGYKLDALIQQGLREANIRVNRDVVDYLSANLGSDRRVTRSELEKIVLYVGDAGTLSLEEATQLVGNSAELTTDDLCAAIANGNLKQVERVLHKQLREGVAPVAVTRSLQRYFQRLHLLSSMMRQKGMGPDQAMDSLKPPVFFKQKPLLRQHLELWSLRALEAALVLLTEAEQALKSSGSASADSQLQHYVFEVLFLGSKSRKKAA